MRLYCCANCIPCPVIDSYWQVRLEKLKQSIATRLPGGWAPRKVDDFLGKIDAAITTAWRIFGQVRSFAS